MTFEVIEVDYNFFATNEFQKAAEEMWPNVPLAALMRQVGEHLYTANHITADIYKLRVSLAGKGKRGGGRIIYFEMRDNRELYLITAYKKSEKEDLTQEEVKELENFCKNLRSKKEKDYGYESLGEHKARVKGS